MPYRVVMIESRGSRRDKVRVAAASSSVTKKSKRTANIVSMMMKIQRNTRGIFGLIAMLLILDKAAANWW